MTVHLQCKSVLPHWTSRKQSQGRSEGSGRGLGRALRPGMECELQYVVFVAAAAAATKTRRLPVRA